jgi:hypothetical protein
MKTKESKKGFHFWMRTCANGRASARAKWEAARCGNNIASSSGEANNRKGETRRMSHCGQAVQCGRPPSCSRGVF